MRSKMKVCGEISGTGNGGRTYRRCVMLAVALVIEFGVIAFGNAQGQGDIIKKVLPWVIGTAGILGATSIVNFFFSNVKSETISMAAFMLPLIV